MWGAAACMGRGRWWGTGRSRAQLLEVNPNNRSFLVVMAKAEVTHGWVRGMRWMPPPPQLRMKGPALQVRGSTRRKLLL